MTLRSGYVGAVLSVVLLTSGCVSLQLPETRTGNGATPSAETAPEIVEVREYFPLSQFDDFRAPQLVGLTLTDAEDAVAQWDLYISTEDATGQDRSVWLAGNWTVVSQKPRMGTPMSEGDAIDLEVMKNSESGDAVALYLADDPHLDESRFTGRVTGYGDEGDLGTRTVMVDGAIVGLDLIEPIANGCGIELGAGLDQARAVKEDLLPVGDRVLVVRSEDHEDDGFIHLVDDSSNDPVPSLSGEGSANESLVASGWWTPNSLDFEGGFVANRSDGVAFVAFAPDSSLTSVQAQYAGPIAAAGTNAVGAKAAGLGICRTLAETDASAWLKTLAESEERTRQWTLEYERRVKEGYYSCRDGDGDGICHER